MYRRILVASDGSECGLKAVIAAADLAARCRAPLTALHVYEMPAFQSEMMGGGMINGLESLDPRMMDEWMEGANLVIRRKIEAAIRPFDVTFTYLQQIGHAANTIVRVAKEEQSDLVVLGSRGLNGLEAFLLGSVSERVAHLAHCSVLIVR